MGGCLPVYQKLPRSGAERRETEESRVVANLFSEPQERLDEAQGEDRYRDQQIQRDLESTQERLGTSIWRLN